MEDHADLAEAFWRRVAEFKDGRRPKPPRPAADDSIAERLRANLDASSWKLAEQVMRENLDPGEVLKSEIASRVLISGTIWKPSFTEAFWQRLAELDEGGR